MLCAVQDAPQSFDLAESLDRLEALTADAVDQAWDAAAAKWPGEVEFEMIVVFPEGFLSSYPRGLDFGSPIGSRSKEGREWYRRYFDSSVPVSDTNGAVMQRIRGVAKKNEVTLVVGVIERCNCEVTAGVGEPARETWAAKEKGGHGSLYCTSLMIGTEGEIISSRRKLQPTGLERLVWGQGSASDISVAVKDTAVGRVGSAICWENYMPLFRYTLYEKGTQIWCAPTADARDQWAGTMTHVALEGRCFVVSCCQYAERKDYPDDHPAYKGEQSMMASEGGERADSSVRRDPQGRRQTTSSRAEGR